MGLENPAAVRHHLGRAVLALSAAHAAAGEREGDRTGLTGSARDLIFGLNSAVDALSEAIAEGRWDDPVSLNTENSE